MICFLSRIQAKLYTRSDLKLVSGFHGPPAIGRLTMFESFVLLMNVSDRPSGAHLTPPLVSTESGRSNVFVKSPPSNESRPSPVLPLSSVKKHAIVLPSGETAACRLTLSIS